MTMLHIPTTSVPPVRTTQHIFARLGVSVRVLVLFVAGLVMVSPTIDTTRKCVVVVYCLYWIKPSHASAVKFSVTYYGR
jgi:hypothetical protein